MANEYLKRQPISSGNSRRWTVSFWMKNSDPTQGYTAIMGAGKVSPTNVYNEIFYNGSQTGINLDNSSASDNYNITANPLLRDPSSWMHVVVSFTDQGDNANTRIKFYINGAFVDHNTGTALDVSETSFFNHKDYIHYIGSRAQQSYGSVTFDAQYFDVFLVDGQALTPDVFGFYKDGKGYQSSGSSDSTDFGPGQWSPHSPRKIKSEIERKGGFGVNGFYLPMNDSSNPGADFHCAPNSIITLKGEDLPQPRNGAPTTSDAYVSQLRQEEGTLGFDGVVAFDGSALNRLTLPVSSDFAFGTGDLTVEMFVYHTDLTGQQTYFGDSYGGGAGADGLYLYKTSTNQISVYDTAQRAVSEANVIKKGQWHHLAWTVSSGVLRQFVDGNKITETSYNGNYTTTQYFLGDTAGTSSGEFVGFMSNVRVIKGTALYTANFTPPTEPLTNVTNTKLLCCNSSTDATAATVTPGTITKTSDVFATRNELTGSIVLAVPGIAGGQGNGFGDYSADIKGSGTNKTLTVNDAGITACASHYGSAMTFDGGGTATANGELVSASSQADFDLGLGDFTLEGWIYAHTNTQDAGVFGIGSGGAEPFLSWTNGVLRFRGNAGSVLITFSDAIAIEQWHHVVLESHNAVLSLIINGVVVGNANNSHTFSAGDFLIGSWTTSRTYGFNGEIQDVRLYKGVAKYKGSFDVPKPYAPVGIEDFRTTADTCKNNFATLNPIDNNSGVLSNGNLTYGDDGSSAWNNSRATIGASSGKWYWEMRPDEINQVICASVAGPSGNDSTNGARLGYLPGQTDDAGVTYYDDGKLYHAGNQNGGGAWGAAYFEGDIIGIALDMDDSGGKVWFSRNGSWQASGNPSTGSNPARSNLKTYADTWFPISGTYFANTTQTFNFGQNPTFGNIAALNKNRINSSTADSVWHQSSNTGTHTDWTVSAGGTELDVAVPSGHYARVQLRSADGTIDLKKKYLLSFKYTTGPSNLGVQNDQGYMTAVDGSVSPNGLSSGNFYSFVFHGSSVITITGFNASTYALDNVIVSEIDECYTDDSGKGKFHYQPPTGFLALCEDNLPTPAIADPSQHFQTLLWTGQGSPGKKVTGLKFKPDLVWIKNRATGVSNSWHSLSDTVRNARLFPNETDAEDSFKDVMSFDDNGFSLGYGTYVNYGNGTYVGWCWKAGGPAVTNNDGSITSQVSANQTAGFSIVSYTGNGTSGTVGHGLGKTPNIILVKNRIDSSNWSFNANIGPLVYGTNKLVLQATGDIQNDTNEVTSVNTTTFTLGNSGATNGQNDGTVAYCWTEIEGFSKFGSYIGNGSTDGPFVYCGFKPAFIIRKRTNNTGGWYLTDSARNSSNTVNTFLDASDSDTDGTGTAVDFLSNGFKLRNSDSGTNASGDTYIFMAFAESPFQTANAK